MNCLKNNVVFAKQGKITPPLCKSDVPTGITLRDFIIVGEKIRLTVVYVIFRFQNSQGNVTPPQKKMRYCYRYYIPGSKAQSVRSSD